MGEKQTNYSEKDHETLKEEITIKDGLVPTGENTLNKLLTKRGGYRPNAGRPRGSRNKLTKEAKVQEKTIKERILKNVDDLVNAQLALAKGIFFMYEIKMRNVAGRRKPEHIRVTDPKKIKAFLDGELEGEYYYISAQSPENKAIDSLLDRAFGKATTENNVNHDFRVEVINYESKPLIEATYEQGSEDTSRLHTEELPAGTDASTTEIQDSGVGSSFREIENSAK